MPIKILVVDDDPQLVRALAELLAQAGYQATCAMSAEDALERCREETFHLTLTDLQLPGKNGISLIKALHEACPETKTVLITGHGSVRTAVTALKRGAVEYIAKPIKPRRLLALIRALTADPPEYLTNRLLDAQKLPTVAIDRMVARSRAMQEVFERMLKAAGSDATVVLVGESGTGKELAARSIHARSRRAEGPFAIGLAELTKAEGGTLFIDDLAELDEAGQAALYKLIEALGASNGARRARPDVRLIAASTHDLEELVRVGKLREDLYFRLNVLVIKIPPLRDRPEDVPVLAGELMRDFAERYGKPVTTLPAETQRILASYSWPGNVRELRNVIEQAVLLARTPELDSLLLPQMLHRGPGQREKILKIAIGTAMDQIEREVILRTLEANGGNKTATAEVLGISRRSIYNKLAVYGIASDGGV